MTTNNLLLRESTTINLLGTNLKYIPLSFTHLGTFLKVIASQNLEVRNKLNEALTLDKKMEILKDYTVPLLESPETMIQTVFDLSTEDSFYEVLGICYPALKDVDRNRLKPAICIVLFFLVWFTLIPEITKQTVEIGQELSNSELAEVISHYGNISYQEGVNNLKTLENLGK